MREIFIDKNDPYYKKPKAFYILVFSIFIFGGLIAYLFIPTERKIVEVTVEKVKYVDRVVEKKVEVPVDRIQYVDRVVEKRVEVPVEKIQYVDRIVEKRVEIPVEKVIYRSQQDISSDKQNWRSLKRGISTSEVRRILGEPSNITTDSTITVWYYGKYPYGGEVTFYVNIKYDDLLLKYLKTESVSGWREPN